MIRMEDIHVTASASGKLDITMYFAEGAGDVSVKLISPKGRSWRWKGTVEGDSLHMVQNIRSPRLWSAETPNLYELEITVRDTLGNKTQTAVSHVGFRDVEVRGKQFLVNGKPVLIKGVNRHEMTARRGPFMTKEDMLEDIQQVGCNFDLIPIIAHVDRYMAVLKDQSLIERVLQRGMVVQVNGSYFLNPKTTKAALANLKAGKIQLIGSDCHNMDSRPPCLGMVRKLVRDNYAGAVFQTLHANAADLLMNRRV